MNYGVWMDKVFNFPDVEGNSRGPAARVEYCCRLCHRPTGLRLTAACPLAVWRRDVHIRKRHAILQFFIDIESFFRGTKAKFVLRWFLLPTGSVAYATNLFKRKSASTTFSSPNDLSPAMQVSARGFDARS